MSEIKTLRYLSPEETRVEVRTEAAAKEAELRSQFEKDLRHLMVTDSALAVSARRSRRVIPVATNIPRTKQKKQT